MFIGHFRVKIFSKFKLINFSLFNRFVFEIFKSVISPTIVRFGKAEDDVKNERTAPVSETFHNLRVMLQEK